MTPRHLAVPTLALSLLTSFAPSASAATGSASDPRGDAPAYIDVTRVTVRNATARVTFRVKVRDLGKGGTLVAYLYDGSSGVEFKAHRRANGSVAVKVTNTDLDDTYPVDCSDVRGSWQPAKDKIKLSAPQDCFQVTDTPSSWFAGVTMRGRAGDKADKTDGLTVERG